MLLPKHSHSKSEDCKPSTAEQREVHSSIRRPDTSGNRLSSGRLIKLRLSVACSQVLGFACPGTGGEEAGAKYVAAKVGEVGSG
jgi:hypothetical protein